MSTCDQLFDFWQNPRHDDVDARCIGMQTVVLHQIKFRGCAFKKERIEQRVVFGRQFRINGLECRAVIGAEIGRRAYAAQEHGEVPLAQAMQQPIERVARDLRSQPAQHIVGAKLDDYGIGPIRHRPFEPRQTTGSRIAGDAGIGDLGGDTLGGERCLQPRCKAVLGRQAETSRKRIAQRHDLDRLLRICRRNSGGNKRYNANRRTRDLAEPASVPI